MGDEVLKFGSAEAGAGLNAIASIVSNSENRPINVLIKRNNTVITLQLIPKKWQGQGLLGFGKFLLSLVNRNSQKHDKLTNHSLPLYTYTYTYTLQHMQLPFPSRVTFVFIEAPQPIAE